MKEQPTQSTQRHFHLPGWAKILIAIVLTLALSTGAWALLLGPGGRSMVKTFLLARFAFVDINVDLDHAVNQSLDAFVKGLGDQWSYYLDQHSYQQVMDNRANRYVGIGITVTLDREEGLLVQSVVQEGPAQQAGVRPGDIITAVDGTSLAGEARYSGTDLVTGEAGSQVTLTLLREDGSTPQITCTRSAISSPSAHGQMLEHQVGYVRLSNFYSGAADSFIKEVDSLLEQGAQSLVIDLRDDPGGYVGELQSILDYLLPEGPVFIHRPRWGREHVYQSDPNWVGVPMAALVNRDTYSAAELLAAQLQESVGAPIVGERTSGKGYSQVTFPLPNGGGVGLSTATYCTGNGHSLIGTGLIPDAELPLSSGAIMGGKDDNQLQAVLSLLDETKARS